MRVQQHFREPANKYLKIITVPFRRNGCNCMLVLFDCCSNKLVWLSYLIAIARRTPSNMKNQTDEGHPPVME